MLSGGGCDSQITQSEEDDKITFNQIPLVKTTPGVKNGISRQSVLERPRYYCLVGTLNPSGDEWAYTHREFALNIPPGLLKQAQATGKDDQWITFSLGHRNAGGRYEADEFEGGGLARMAKCMLPPSEKIFKKVLKQLNKFKKGSWIYRYKSTAADSSTTEGVGPDPVQPGWEYYCSAYWVYEQCWRDPDTGIKYGCTYTVLGCSETEMVPSSDDNEGEGGTLDDGGNTGNPCAPDDQGRIPIDCQDALDPCQQANELEDDDAFISKMEALLNNANNKNYETGYLMTGNANGGYSYSYDEGNPSAPNMHINPPNPIDGFIHSHYGNGQYSIFSAQDIRSIHQLNERGDINDLETFTMGLVTAKGATYLLKINDVNKFNTFADQKLDDEGSFTGFENLFIDLYQIKEENSVNKNETGFVQMLDQLDSGLKLFKGDTDNFDTWQAKKVNSNGTVIDDDC